MIKRTDALEERSDLTFVGEVDRVPCRAIAEASETGQRTVHFFLAARCEDDLGALTQRGLRCREAKAGCATQKNYALSLQHRITSVCALQATASRRSMRLASAHSCVRVCSNKSCRSGPTSSSLCRCTTHHGTCRPRGCAPSSTSSSAQRKRPAPLGSKAAHTPQNVGLEFLEAPLPSRQNFACFGVRVEGGISHDHRKPEGDQAEYE